jgi:hypothetical protein
MVYMRKQSDKSRRLDTLWDAYLEVRRTKWYGRELLRSKDV